VLAFALASDGREESDRARALDLLASAEPGAAADGTFTYWIAKVHAQLGDAATAMAWIDRARQLGFWDAAWMRRDVALEILQPLPEFEKLVGEIAARRAAFVAFARKEAPPLLAELLAADDGSR
jgi:hypothetical protein